MTTSEKPAAQSEDAIEQVLALAEPRPAPSATATAAARATIKAEWQQAIRRRTVRRYAVAISAIVAAAVWISTISLQPGEPVAMATVDTVIGEVSYLNEDGYVEHRSADAVITAGEILTTKQDASVGLRLNSGGSLRLDGNTSVRFIDSGQIELRAGRVYVDSGLDEGQFGALVIHTDYGDVRHLGTQYMADIRDSDLLRVSVREGEVSVAGLYHMTRVKNGEQLVLHGNRRPIKTRLTPYSHEWQWTHAVAPRTDMNGKTFYQLLEWVSHETGLGFRFATPAAEEAAYTTVRGVEGSDPLTTLRVGAAAAQLAVEQIDGELLVTVRGP